MDSQLLPPTLTAGMYLLQMNPGNAQPQQAMVGRHYKKKIDFKEGSNWKPGNIINNKHLLGEAWDDDGLFNMSPKRKVIWADPKVRTSHCRLVLDPGGNYPCLS